jgi:hypothetical protein
MHIRTILDNSGYFLIEKLAAAKIKKKKKIITWQTRLLKISNSPRAFIGGPLPTVAVAVGLAPICRADPVASSPSSECSI